MNEKPGIDKSTFELYMTIYRAFIMVLKAWKKYIEVKAGIVVRVEDL